MDDLFQNDDLDGNESDEATGLDEQTDPVDSYEPMPLAARMRPRTIDEYVGQQHILGPGKLLRRAVEADRFTSLIFYGPPGVGKTSLAELIAQRTDSRFVNLSGVESNVAEIRQAVEAAKGFQRTRKLITTLFVDEIHRFNKSQQDVLLPHIERGTVRFIGATTHNPFFYINSPLVSRSQVFQLEPLEEEDLAHLIRWAVEDEERGFGKKPIRLDEDAAAHFVRMCDGDARKLLTSFELAVLTTEEDEESGEIVIDLEVAADSIQRKTVVYDADGDAHHDTISAFIKSMRGSDPDAALYWLAKMLYAGEDIRFIARRIVIAASEDVGMADSNALRVAVAAQQAVDFIGMPEARIPLAHAAVYIATAPKSNRAYAGINAAMQDVKEGRTLAVPPHLRTKSRKKLGVEGGAVGADDTLYLYGHDYDGGYVPQAYLPEGRQYYEPSENGLEKRIESVWHTGGSNLRQETERNEAKAQRHWGFRLRLFLDSMCCRFSWFWQGRALASFEWVENLGLGYALTSTTDERGFVFESDPWMKIYRPLYSETVLYKRSRNPADTVTLNGYGIAMFAVYYWGMWPDEDWAKASSTAKKFAMSSYGEWFPERYE